MGMLMHHTLMKQQEEPNEKDNGKRVEEPVEEPKPEAPVKKTGGRRKVSK